MIDLLVALLALVAVALGTTYTHTDGSGSFEVNGYTNNMQDLYVVNVADAVSASLECSVQLETNYDYLRVYEAVCDTSGGVSLGTEYGGGYTGTTSLSQDISYGDTTANCMVVKFTTDYSVTRTGFSCEYSTVVESEDRDWTQLSAQTGTITVDAAQYIDNMSEKWVIAVPEAKSIHLQCSGYIENGWDNLIVYSGVCSFPSSMRGVGYTSRFSVDTTYETEGVEEGCMALAFSSDSSVSGTSSTGYTGFTCTYVAEIDSIETVSVAGRAGTIEQGTEAWESEKETRWTFDAPSLTHLSVECSGTLGSYSDYLYLEMGVYEIAYRPSSGTNAYLSADVDVPTDAVPTLVLNTASDSTPASFSCTYSTTSSVTVTSTAEGVVGSSVAVYLPSSVTGVSMADVLGCSVTSGTNTAPASYSYDTVMGSLNVLVTATGSLSLSLSFALDADTTEADSLTYTLYLAGAISGSSITGSTRMALPTQTVGVLGMGTDSVDYSNSLEGGAVGVDVFPTYSICDDTVESGTQTKMVVATMVDTETETEAEAETEGAEEEPVVFSVDRLSLTMYPVNVSVSSVAVESYYDGFFLFDGGLEGETDGDEEDEVEEGWDNTSPIATAFLGNTHHGRDIVTFSGSLTLSGYSDSSVTHSGPVLAYAADLDQMTDAAVSQDVFDTDAVGVLWYGLHGEDSNSEGEDAWAMVSVGAEETVSYSAVLTRGASDLLDSVYLCTNNLDLQSRESSYESQCVELNAVLAGYSSLSVLTGTVAPEDSDYLDSESDRYRVVLKTQGGQWLGASAVIEVESCLDGDLAGVIIVIGVCLSLVLCCCCCRKKALKKHKAGQAPTPTPTEEVNRETETTVDARGAPVVEPVALTVAVSDGAPSICTKKQAKRERKAAQKAAKALAKTERQKQKAVAKAQRQGVRVVTNVALPPTSKPLPPIALPPSYASAPVAKGVQLPGAGVAVVNSGAPPTYPTPVPMPQFQYPPNMAMTQQQYNVAPQQYPQIQAQMPVFQQVPQYQYNYGVVAPPMQTVSVPAQPNTVPQTQQAPPPGAVVGGVQAQPPSLQVGMVMPTLTAPEASEE
ncbi:hypothetical protein KIPB_000969 [Kipferlia bialata]|uniref:CUB domain-containing protein n=1 Tax=Kipferlia bialata TaxID=797122 RepID=A0A9K3CRC9_9EUKA|nr:hypothetical protein KIPB_000969 [Kipferlia bialata]|eukprot:g969.t1